MLRSADGIRRAGQTGRTTPIGKRFGGVPGVTVAVGVAEREGVKR